MTRPRKLQAFNFRPKYGTTMLYSLHLEWHVNFLIVLHIFITIALIAVILLQKGESGGITPSSGQGLFTARGSANFLTRTTGILATIFMVNCIAMVLIANYYTKQETAIIKNIQNTETKK